MFEGCILVCGNDAGANETAKCYCKLSEIIFTTEENPDRTEPKPKLSAWKDFNTLEGVAVGHEAIRQWLSDRTPLQYKLDAEHERLQEKRHLQEISVLHTFQRQYMPATR